MKHKKFKTVVIALIILLAGSVVAQSVGGWVKSGNSKIRFSYSIAVWDLNRLSLTLYLFSELPKVSKDDLEQIAKSRRGIAKAYKGKQSFAIFEFKFKEQEGRIYEWKASELKSYMLTSFDVSGKENYSLYVKVDCFSNFSFEPQNQRFNARGKCNEDWKVDVSTTVWQAESM